MTPRFFFDETDLLLAKRMSVALPGEVVYPGHQDLPGVSRDAFDRDRLPVVAARSLVVITRDKAIRRKPVELRLWIDHELRGFVLTGRDSQKTSASMSLILANQSKIDQLIAEQGPGPWMMAISSAGVREIELA